MEKVKMFLGLLSLGAVSVALFSCGSSDEQDFLSNRRPLGVGDAAMANSVLEKSVRDKLASHHELSAVVGVEADVTNNEVILSGAVSSEGLREKAAELAKSAQVGIIVRNRIQVKSQGSNAEVRQSNARL
jgi:osmotically-inducible protein OsmY